MRKTRLSTRQTDQRKESDEKKRKKKKKDNEKISKDEKTSISTKIDRTTTNLVYHCNDRSGNVNMGVGRGKERVEEREEIKKSARISLILGRIS